MTSEDDERPIRSNRGGPIIDNNAVQCTSS